MNYLKISFAFFFASLAIFSCQKDLRSNIDTSLVAGNTIAIDRNDSELITTYSVIGEIHNAGVDAVYETLNAKAESGNYNVVPSTDLDQAVFAFLRANQYLQLDLSQESQYYPKGDMYDVIFGTNFLEASMIQNLQATCPEHTFSQEFINAVNAFDIIFNDKENYSNAALYNSLLTSHVPLIATELEKIALISMVSVAQSSINYWENNLGKWNDLRSKMGTELLEVDSRESNVPDAAKADAYGAAAGAIRGASIGLAGGTVAIPGLGTAVGGAGGVLVGMIGGAIAGSVGAVIENALFDWF